MTSAALRLLPAESDADFLALFPIVQQLRPRFQNPETFLATIATQRRENYLALGAWRDDKPCGYAGYRILHNLVHGRFLYVDDLVTSDDTRSAGVGSAIMDGLKEIARHADCNRLVLDTRLDNSLAQRFYFRHGLLPGGLHFAIAL